MQKSVYKFFLVSIAMPFSLVLNLKTTWPSKWLKMLLPESYAERAHLVSSWLLSKAYTVVSFQLLYAVCFVQMHSYHNAAECC